MGDYDLRDLAARIFLDAAQYIRQLGWRVEGMAHDGEPRCSMGALASAYPEEYWNETMSQLMYSYLYEELDGISLTQFNHKYEDGEKVAQLYERVAAKITSKMLTSA